MKPLRRFVLSAIASAAALVAGSARADSDPLFVLGSSFQVQATNSPDSFTETVTLAPGTTLLDNGALRLTISIVPDTGSSEWLVFSYSTTGGGAFSQPNSNWSLNQIGLDAAVAVNFIGAYSQFLHGTGGALIPQRADRLELENATIKLECSLDIGNGDAYMEEAIDHGDCFR